MRAIVRDLQVRPSGCLGPEAAQTLISAGTGSHPARCRARPGSSRRGPGSGFPSSGRRIRPGRACGDRPPASPISLKRSPRRCARWRARAGAPPPAPPACHAPTRQQGPPAVWTELARGPWQTAGERLKGDLGRTTRPAWPRSNPPRPGCPAARGCEQDGVPARGHGLAFQGRRDELEVRRPIGRAVDLGARGAMDHHAIDQRIDVGLIAAPELDDQPRIVGLDGVAIEGVLRSGLLPALGSLPVKAHAMNCA